VCLSEETEGLGVRRLRDFNSALLGKWSSRMLVDNLGSWHRTLVARYGETVGRVRTGGRGVSSWQREISRLRDGSVDGEDHGWFVEGVERRVGDGALMCFWSDPRG
jgi:hypothetical protein